MLNRITEDTTLSDIPNLPGAGEVPAKYDLPCLYCPMAAYEIGMLKIGEVAKMYGIDIKRLIDDLNKNK